MILYVQILSFQSPEFFSDCYALYVQNFTKAYNIALEKTLYFTIKLLVTYLITKNYKNVQSPTNYKLTTQAILPNFTSNSNKLVFLIRKSNFIYR